MRAPDRSLRWKRPEGAPVGGVSVALNGFDWMEWYRVDEVFNENDRVFKPFKINMGFKNLIVVD